MSFVILATCEKCNDLSWLYEKYKKAGEVEKAKKLKKLIDEQKIVVIMCPYAANSMKDPVDVTVPEPGFGGAFDKSKIKKLTLAKVNLCPAFQCESRVGVYCILEPDQRKCFEK